MKHIYTYYGQAISFKEFNKNVPENWKEEIYNGTYSYGGYRVTEIED
jgi:hypothetical protein